MATIKKISPNHQFIRVFRTNSRTHEEWTEVINLNSIKAIKEYRVGKEAYGTAPGRRRGYEVMLDGGHWGTFWINDAEFEIICELLGIGFEKENKEI